MQESLGQGSVTVVFLALRAGAAVRARDDHPRGECWSEETYRRRVEEAVEPFRVFEGDDESS